MGQNFGVLFTCAPKFTFLLPDYKVSAFFKKSGSCFDLRKCIKYFDKKKLFYIKDVRV